MKVKKVMNLQDYKQCISHLGYSLEYILKCTKMSAFSVCIFPELYVLFCFFSSFTTKQLATLPPVAPPHLSPEEGDPGL